MTALEVLVWAAAAWAAWLGFCIADVPTLAHQLADRYRGGDR